MTPIPTPFDDLEFIERVIFLRMQYQYATGRLPTHLVLTDADLVEFAFWLDTADDKAPYIAEPFTCEPQLYGMSVRIEKYTKQMRVYFQES